MYKVAVLQGDGLPYERAFVDSGTCTTFSLVDSPDEADIICFTGGSDISPKIYNAKVDGSLGIDVFRDHKELRLISNYQGRKVLVGICRGFQLLSTAIHGFQMQQHDEAHSLLASHMLDNGQTVNSLHHQLVIGEPTRELSSVLRAHGGGHIEGFMDLRTRTGGVQWHPELQPNSWGLSYFRNMCRTLLEDAKQ